MKKGNNLMMERLNKVQNRKPLYKPISERDGMIVDYHKFSVNNTNMERRRVYKEIRNENLRLAGRIHSQYNTIIVEKVH